jgi:acetyltransferase-like isoleucine patch superfamily enzyme|tara:strand:+ start:444 stop:1055 length:612 start_codon:yes stop_codon:yes gene_type:complete
MIKDFNLIKKINVRIWYFLNRFRFKSIGKKSFIDSPLKITPLCISLGQNVRIFKNCRIEGVFSYNNINFNPSIIVGNNVSVQQNLHLTCANSIVIGKNTAIASNVTITDIHHQYENIKIPIESQDILVQQVKIGENCKIYNNSVILPGSKIGNHVSIGANSVVAIEIPDYCVVVGAPAKIVKRYNFETKNWDKTNSDGSFLNL